MVNYQNGKIYVIRSNNTNNVYIGSTTRPLSERMGEHRTRYNCNRGKSSAEVLKHGGAYIELIEEYPCDNREQLCKREGEVMRATENIVNKVIAGRAHKESRDEHKVEKKRHNVKYYNENKEQILQHSATKIRCQCGLLITRGWLTGHKRTNLHKTEMEILELAGEL